MCLESGCPRISLSTVDIDPISHFLTLPVSWVLAPKLSVSWVFPSIKHLMNRLILETNIDLGDQPGKWFSDYVPRILGFSVVSKDCYKSRGTHQALISVVCVYLHGSKIFILFLTIVWGVEKILIYSNTLMFYDENCLAGWSTNWNQDCWEKYNNLRYADDTTLMADSEEELKSLLMKVKEESEKAGLKLNFQKTKIMASGPITSWQINGETMETMTDFIFLGRITADGSYSHEIKRSLLLGRKVMTNLDSILKSRGITLPTKVHLVKAMVFPVVIYGCESWTIKKAERRKIDAFELWCWRRLLRVPWTARRSNQSIRKEISPEYSLEGLMLKLKFSVLWPLDTKNWFITTDSDAGKDWRQEQKQVGRQDEMVGWHHWLGCEFE